MKQIACLALLLIFPLGCKSADRGEFWVSAYVGKSRNNSSDVQLRRDDRNLQFDAVDFDDESFTQPIFWCVRGGYWMKALPEYGFMLEFSHPKAISDTSQVTNVAGNRNGAPYAGRQPISDDIQELEMSHGYNFLTLNFMRRWFPTGKRDTSFWGRMQPYAGVGAGLAIPHVQATVDGVSTSEYQIAGWTMQGLLGINYDLVAGLSAFLEYKLNYSSVDMNLSDGGSISTEIWTNAFILGLSYRF
jgi:lipid A oxidase